MISKKKTKKEMDKEFVKKVSKIARKVDMNNDEKKLWLYTSGVIGGAATNNTGSIQYMTFMTQGDSVTNRTGDTVDLRDIEFRGSITTTNTATASFFRIVAGFDMRPGVDVTATSTSLGVLDVLQTANPFAGRQITNRNARRLRIIYDELFKLDPLNVATGVITDRCIYKLDRKFPKLQQRIVFAPTATIAQKARMFYCVISDQGANSPQLNWIWNGRFTDA